MHCSACATNLLDNVCSMPTRSWQQQDCLQWNAEQAGARQTPSKKPKPNRNRDQACSRCLSLGSNADLFISHHRALMQQNQNVSGRVILVSDQHTCPGEGRIRALRGRGPCSHMACTVNLASRLYIFTCSGHVSALLCNLGAIALVRCGGQGHGRPHSGGCHTAQLCPGRRGLGVLGAQVVGHLLLIPEVCGQAGRYARRQAGRQA